MIKMYRENTESLKVFTFCSNLYYFKPLTIHYYYKTLDEHIFLKARIIPASEIPEIEMETRGRFLN